MAIFEQTDRVRAMIRAGMWLADRARVTEETHMIAQPCPVLTVRSPQHDFVMPDVSRLEVVMLDALQRLER